MLPVGVRYDVLTAEEAMSLNVMADGSNRYVSPAIYSVYTQ